MQPSLSASSAIIRRLTCLVCLAVLATAAACSSDDGNDSKSSADAGSAADVHDKPCTKLPSGDYFLGVRLLIAGVRVPFQTRIESEGCMDQGGTLTKVELFGTGYSAANKGWLSPRIALAEQVAVKPDNSFVLDFGDLTVPSKTSPTGGATKSAMVLHGSIADDGTMCGQLKGHVLLGSAVSLTSATDQSTFKAVPLEQVSDPFEISCPQKVKNYQHIATCPKISAGENDITSAEIKRQFHVVLPDNATATNVPVVFLYHGKGGDINGILNSTKMEQLAKSEGFILVTPRSARDANGKRRFDIDWSLQSINNDMDNVDLVLFDDLLKCVGEVGSIDKERIYVTGMSGGGLMSTSLGANRSKTIAAAAPFSGGYLGSWPKSQHKVPFLVGWGGKGDISNKQSFDQMAKDLLVMLKDNGHEHAACNHGQAHKWPKGATALVWDFLAGQTLSKPTQPFGGKPLPALCNP